MGPFINKLSLGAKAVDLLKRGQLKKLTERNQFSAYLNYLAYDPDLEVYLNQNGSLGLLWECTPVIFAGPKTLKTLEGLFRAGLPPDSVVQFIFYADEHIEPILTEFQKRRVRDDRLVRENTRRVVDFLRKGNKGLRQCADIPIRNFRLFVAVTIPGDAKNIPKPEEFSEPAKTIKLLDIKRQIVETLQGASLYPAPMRPEELLEWGRRFFNSYPKNYPEHNFNSYSPEIPIRKQMINGDTVIKEHSDCLQVGEKYVCITTPKNTPAEVDSMKTNSLFGGIWGVISDADQVKTGFMATASVIIEKGLKVSIHTKCNMLLNQQSFGSLATSLARRQDEFSEATDKIEQGQEFVKIIYTVSTWHRQKEKAQDSLNLVMRLWENNGYVMQKERMISKILLLTQLPFGLYMEGKNLENIDRDFIAPVDTVIPTLPIQGDFEGTGEPVLLFAGRKGELVAIDFFGKGAVNHNVYCCATTGAGKSFFVNYVAFNYYACGALVRIIDIGGSYKKMATMLGVRYLDFDEDTDVCLNPFTHIREPEKELKGVLPIFAQMVHANTNTEGDDTEINLIRNAIQWAWDQKGNEADADTVYEFLMTFPNVKEGDLEELSDNKQLIARARGLAFNIRAFTSKGPHGRFFTGHSTFDIKNDEFVVLELEHLKAQPDLYRVVTLLIINAVTQDLYLSNRKRKRFIIFDEAHQFLKKGGMIAPVIDEGYRRARKYGGCFMIITQSILDLDMFGDVGTVIKGQSAFKIYLESGDFDRAQKIGLIEYDPFILKLLKSVTSNPPKYSELFFDTPFGVGVGRLVVNDYAYFLYTSKADEVAMIEEMIIEGKTSHQAIQTMVDLRKDGKI